MHDARYKKSMHGARSMFRSLCTMHVNKKNAMHDARSMIRPPCTMQVSKNAKALKFYNFIVPAWCLPLLYRAITIKITTMHIFVIIRSKSIKIHALF